MTAKYDKSNEVLFLEQNRPKLRHILAYFLATFYVLPKGLGNLVHTDLFLKTPDKFFSDMEKSAKSHMKHAFHK